MVITANGEVQTSEEAQVYVHDLELFVMVQTLDDSPAVLLLGKLCEEHGETFDWASGHEPRLTKNGEKDCVPVVVPGIVVKLERQLVFYIAAAGLIKYLSESSKTTK